MPQNDLQQSSPEFPGGLAAYLEKMKHSVTPSLIQEEDHLQKSRPAQDSYQSAKFVEIDLSKGITFGEALIHLQAGDKLARQGWNGKNMFIFKTVGNTVSKDFIPKFASLPDSVKVFLLQKDQAVVFQDSLTMYCADGTLQPGWLASQRDMLANDWEVLP